MLVFYFFAKHFILILFQLAEITPTIDTTAPRTYMHMHLKPKKLQVIILYFLYFSLIFSHFWYMITAYRVYLLLPIVYNFFIYALSIF